MKNNQMSEQNIKDFEGKFFYHTKFKKFLFVSYQVEDWLHYTAHSYFNELKNAIENSHCVYWERMSVNNVNELEYICHE